MSTEQEYAETKQMVREAMLEEDIPPQTLVRLGDLAKQVLEDQSLYPQFAQELIASELADEEDVSKEVDLQLVSVIVAVGEMTKQMIESGEIEA
jgi:hypothetical protein